MELELSKNGEKVEGESSEGFIFKGPTESSLKNLTVGKLLDTQSRQNPDKVAVVSRWQGTSLTYEALHSSSRKIAQRLLAHGVRPKDRVVVMAGNAIEYTQLFFAVGGLGAVFAIVNPTFTQDEALAAVEFLSKSFSHCDFEQQSSLRRDRNICSALTTNCRSRCRVCG
jgi:acyl-coenzyme A synthetase/AMP-(fatty) acid ligase